MGEIRMFSGNYAPPGWLMCDGQMLNIGDNQVLYALIGTTYGGNGSTTFALPDLRGRVPIHNAPTHPVGQMAGTETVTVLPTQLPAHSHAAQAQTAVGTASSPASGVWASTKVNNYIGVTSELMNMSPTTIAPVGGTQPHENMMPFMAISFIIATAGMFPSRP
ncbi:phage tail protein [Janthinobacterium sp. HLX7-2]|uniref:phage tail protein n=1 Tax=Janthinobacterium sp. HLX7-2 TaxID=1259331 RepID=UPI003F20E7FD